jgi:putative ABC transport system permease protein
MSAPKWTHALLRRFAREHNAEDVIGDLEEAHSRRIKRHGHFRAGLLTSLEALELAFAMVRARTPRLLPTFSWLDYKLGFRMLVKYPGLTLVGGVAIAFAIGIGTATFEFITDFVRPTVPLPEGKRIVELRLWHTASSSVEEQALHDFAAWRSELRTVQDLGAFRTIQRNVTITGGQAEPMPVAEISASVFRVARVPVLLGRPLREADEEIGAPRVAVIGYDVWRDRLLGDPAIIGKIVRIGGDQVEIVGVMPEGFAFPVAHSMWVPLRENPLHYERRQGPEINVIGRLASGVTLSEARAELTAIGGRRAADFPDTHEFIRPQIDQYPRLGTSGFEALLFQSGNLFLIMLLVLICSNVALLIFARAAARENELVVRNALGASRGRIITQLFAEALVLGGVGALVGLVAATAALRWWLRVAEADGGQPLPFWFEGSLAPMTVLYAIGLTLLGAVVAGVVPALNVTRGVGSRLRAAAAGGGGARFGGVWTAVIVAQVAVTVAFPATAFFVRRTVVATQTVDVGFRTDRFLSVRLEQDRETPPGVSGDAYQAALSTRFRTSYDELARRVATEPGVVGVTFVNHLPRTHHRHERLELDGNAAQIDSALAYTAAPAYIDLQYFNVLGAPILSGRAFNSGDLATDQRVVIVNQSFVREVLGNRSPIGRRVRYIERQAENGQREVGPWYEIVGVVRDLGIMAPKSAGLYHPATPLTAQPLYMVVHLRGEPDAFAPKLRTLAATIDPTLRLHDVLPLSRVGSELWLEFDFIFKLLVMVCAIALLLSLTAIYAVMAFTVARRTREIGIRVALGSDARYVALAILARPIRQVAIGVIVGGILVGMLTFGVFREIAIKELAMLLAYAVLMMAVCMLACIVPTRRALRIQPLEALRTEA